MGDFLLDPVGKYQDPDMSWIQDLPERDLYKETSDTLQAQVDLAPDVYAAESSDAYGRPAYARLQTQINQENLPALNELSNQLTSATRAADIADVAALGPEAKAAFDAANPEQAALRDALLGRASSELALGSSLSAEEIAMGNESVRSAYADQGRSFGNPAITREVLNRYLLGEARQRERQNFAGSILGLTSQSSIDPGLAVLGRGTTVSTPQAQSMLGDQQPNYFDPYGNAYAADLYNTNFNAGIDLGMNAMNAGLAQQQANQQAGLGAASLALLAFCWVAQAAYGVEDERWKLFRLWLLTRAPTWLANAYRTHGPVIAEGVRRVPVLKPILRGLMNLAIRQLPTANCQLPTGSLATNALHR